jgi:hypothetical protein
MNKEKRPLKVFLCHAHSDRDKVRVLYSRLKREGVDAWLDKEKLLPGADWEFEIRKAVREADVVVVCLSKEFNQAGFRQKEVRIALDAAMHQPDGEIFIIPARLEECENLESLSKWHWVDLFEDGGYQSLIRALRARADRIGATLRIRRGGKPIVSPPMDEESEKAEQDRLAKAAHDEQEREAAEKNAREKAEKETAEKARLEAEEQARQKAAKEKAELEAAEKIAREKAQKEAFEKARLETEELARQKAAKEKADRETAEKNARGKAEKETAEKARLEAEEQAMPGPTEPPPVQQISDKRFALWGVGFVVVIFIIGLLAPNNGNKPQASVPTSTFTSSPSRTPETTITSTKTNTPTPNITSTNTVGLTISPTPLPDPYSVLVEIETPGDPQRCRTEPNLISDKNIIDRIPAGIQVLSYGRYENEDGKWLYVEINGRYCWINVLGVAYQDDAVSKLPLGMFLSSGAEMSLVPNGIFEMGATDTTGLYPDEQPIHSVYLDLFYLDKYEVTNDDFVVFLNKNINLVTPYGEYYLFDGQEAFCINRSMSHSKNGVSRTPKSEHAAH